MKQYINPSFPHILHGGDYNPDQWQDRPDILAEDMRLMQLANCNAMSVGIFAWATLEPEEGKFDFSYLDKTINDVYAAGGRIILATPSGARPAWLSKKYPEVLRVNDNGIRNTHGNRHNHCYSSPIYREKVAIINRKIAERYKDHPAVILWHISNEYGGRCYCDNCKKAFREWLKNKYKTLDNLNAQWWTRFWSHTYTSWDQIDPPMPYGETATQGLEIDWLRFVTYQSTDFMKHEIKTVKEITPNLPVTTNFMGFYHDIDYRVMSKELDVISWDSYPYWKATSADVNQAISIAMIHDMNRSLLHKPFMLMESTPSIVNWQPYNKLKRPGMHELTSLQAVAHGSDTVQYFQWRKGRGSEEKFHGAVVDHVGTENTRVFKDVSSLGARLKKLDDIVGTGTNARVAIYYDWNIAWGLEKAQGFQKNNKKYMADAERFYKALWTRGINVDIIGPDDVLENYDIVIAPFMYMVSEEIGAKIKAYVHGGGNIVCTYGTAMVNENDLCYLGGFPGAGLREVFGIWNEEIDSLYPEDSNTVVAGDREFKAVDYCELIHAENAEIIATYASDFYASRPAATVNTYGKGKAYYIAFRDMGDFSDSLIEKLLCENGISSDFDGELPQGVTAHSRTDGESIFVFLQNFTDKEQTTSTKYDWHTVECGEAISGDITLAPYQTLILKK